MSMNKWQLQSLHNFQQTAPSKDPPVSPSTKMGGDENAEWATF